jgi:hypothetical protein
MDTEAIALAVEGKDPLALRLVAIIAADGRALDAEREWSRKLEKKIISMGGILPRRPSARGENNG